jgi:predicted kinase
VIDIPPPALVLLIGAAGAGKSTLAARLFAPSDIISSDDLRLALSGSAADQRATRPAFAILHREVRARLAAGRLVVVDATNAEVHARRPLLRAAAEAGVRPVAIAIIAPAADVHARNRERPGRIVPVEVVDRHLAVLARLGGSSAAVRARLLAEGFADVHVLVSTADLDAFSRTR